MYRRHNFSTRKKYKEKVLLKYFETSCKREIHERECERAREREREKDNYFE